MHVQITNPLFNEVVLLVAVPGYIAHNVHLKYVKGDVYE